MYLQYKYLGRTYAVGIVRMYSTYCTVQTDSTVGTSIIVRGRKGKQAQPKQPPSRLRREHFFSSFSNKN